MTQIRFSGPPTEVEIKATNDLKGLLPASDIETDCKAYYEVKAVMKSKLCLQVFMLKMKVGGQIGILSPSIQDQDVASAPLLG